MDLASITHAEPMRNHDGSTMLDDCGEIVYRSQYLTTHPLRGDCKERMTPGGMILTYMTGDGVIRTMNAAFGHDGWTTEITRERQMLCEQSPDGKKWTVGYMASGRVSISNKNSHEDVGFGEASHESRLKALDTAMKSAITDAMKRATRHFGERLGNALYVAGSGAHTAPKDNKTALRQLEQKESIDLFGNQSLNRELRARKDENRKKIEQGQRTPSSSQHEPHPSTLPLEREVTPTSVDVRASSDQLSREGRESSPQQNPCFTKASELGVTVTPRQPKGPHYAGQHPNAADSRTSSPAVTSPGVTPTVALPPLPRYNPLPVNHSDHPSNLRAAEALPTKRQKVVHNPYQH